MSFVSKFYRAMEKYRELTAEEINEHIGDFIEIYKDGKEINPMPEGVKLTAWCESSDDEGFVCNCTTYEMGITALIARRWITEERLQELCVG